MISVMVLWISDQIVFIDERNYTKNSIAINYGGNISPGEGILQVNSNT